MPELESILSILRVNGRRLYDEKKYKEVEGMLSTFLKEASGESERLRGEAHNDRGHAKYMQVDFTGALEDYDTAITLAPSHHVSYYNRATLNYRLGKFQDAIIDFRTALEKCPGNEDYQKGLEECEKELS
uniref:Tetratricopeptide repeat protein 32 n=1 Tax=Caligus clemensi TaxID=344056 RepID=C1C2K1_CALCM|nr:Tetratricopeptide repeat protein 32 [Caligus clemensi]